MSEKHHVTETPDTSHIKNIDVTHETSDVQVGAIGKFVVGLFVLTVATYLVMWGMFVFMERNEAKLEQQRPRPTMALTGEDRLPPEPRLQGAPGFSQSLESNRPKTEGAEEPNKITEDPHKPKDPLWEMNALRKHWNDALEHGPVDQNGARYGMPIERAKEEVLKQLPVRDQKAVGSKR
ncbi:MAG TPA: hypothetical protein VJT71_15685 [Pyrinomonadaceae bacterium]|nr:hypothetical protein [Pyrinomonadaceae bacterium]